jgi:hypothetical protein
MIERTNAFKVGGQSFLTLQDAQKHELSKLLTGCVPPNLDGIVDWVMANKDKILDILTTTATSKSKARKINGGKKTRVKNELPSTAVICQNPLNLRESESV